MLALMFSKSPCCSAGCLLIYRSAWLKHNARISLQVRHMLVPQLLHLNSSLTSGAVYTDAHSIVRYLKWGKGRQKQCLRNWFWVKGNLSKTSSIRHSLFLFGDPNIEPTQWVIYLQCVRSNLLLLSVTFGRLTRRSQHRIKVLCPVFHPSIYKKKKEKKKKTDIDVLWWVHQRTIKFVESWRTWHEERLREQDLISLQQRWRRDHTAVYRYGIRGYWWTQSLLGGAWQHNSPGNMGNSNYILGKIYLYYFSMTVVKY